MGTPDHARLRSLLAGAHYAQRLRGIDFSGARLDTVRTPDIVWVKRCSFAGADLRHATLDGCHFTLCDMRGVDLRGASLRGASFAGCDLSAAGLRDADLYGASFGSQGRGVTPTRLVGARLDLTSLRSAHVDDDVIWSD